MGLQRGNEMHLLGEDRLGTNGREWTNMDRVLRLAFSKIGAKETHHSKETAHGLNAMALASVAHNSAEGEAVSERVNMICSSSTWGW